MSEVGLLIAQTVKVALIALLLGMMLRGKLAQCWSFTFYVAAILLGNALVTLSPDRFYTPEFWMLKQAVYDVLKMATALELAWRAFSAFPGAWRTARVLLAAILVASTLVLAWLTPHSSYDTFWNWQPSIATAAIWVLTAVALLVWHYQVPITDWQRAIALGFTPYLLVFVTLLSILRRRGWEGLNQYNLLEPLAYLGLVLFWVFAAWRRDRSSVVHETVAEPVKSVA
jgi:hypothetical protein